MINWQQYEAFKQDMARESLSPAEYEARIKSIEKKLYEKERKKPMEEKTVTLKACPFCGEIPELIKLANSSTQVYCPECGIRTAFGSESTVVAKWNRRQAECGDIEHVGYDDAQCGREK